MNNNDKKKKLQIRNSTAEFLIFAYQSKGDGIEVRVQDGTIWLSQKNMGLLFDTSTDNIALHIKNICSEGELSESSTTEDFSVVQRETAVLRDFTLKGYLLDRKRMENGTFLDDDYFERLLEEIREIRLSERRFYQKITDIYSTAMDYNPAAPATKEFFAKVQNKNRLTQGVYAYCFHLSIYA
jgi:hypothetical protein